MRAMHLTTLMTTVMLAIPGAARAQAHDETARPVAGGGVFATGWTGKVDPKEEQAGRSLKDAKLVEEGGGLHVTTGPAVTYWNPANVAKGAYTVKATFTESKFMGLNDHPHPYGLVIAGADLDGSRPTYLYCAAYGNGTFIVRGFGPEPFRVNGPKPEANPAVHKAAGPGEPVTQEIAMSVTDGHVACAVNGIVVGSYDTSAVVAPGKLASTDGIFGLRFGHNTDAVVTGLALTTP